MNPHTLWQFNIAIEHGPVEIVDLPIENGGSFHSFLYVYQRIILIQTIFSGHQPWHHGPAGKIHDKKLDAFPSYKAPCVGHRDFPTSHGADARH